MNGESARLWSVPHLNNLRLMRATFTYLAIYPQPELKQVAAEVAGRFDVSFVIAPEDLRCLENPTLC